MILCHIKILQMFSRVISTIPRLSRSLILPPGETIPVKIKDISYLINRKNLELAASRYQESLKLERDLINQQVDNKILLVTGLISVYSLVEWKPLMCMVSIGATIGMYKFFVNLATTRYRQKKQLTKEIIDVDLMTAQKFVDLLVDSKRVEIAYLKDRSEV